jgi:hypothetical protein
MRAVFIARRLGAQAVLDGLGGQRATWVSRAHVVLPLGLLLFRAQDRRRNHCGQCLFSAPTINTNEMGDVQTATPQAFNAVLA